MRPQPSEYENIEIIDAHSHIGNILYENGGQIIDKKGLKPKNRILDTGWIFAMLQGKVGEKLEARSKLFREFITYSERKRNAGASMENMQKALRRSGVSKTCCLPVPPYVTFDDLKKASETDKHIIPFTGVDFDDMNDFDEKLRQDVSRGALGMKIHPILQNVSPTDERVHEVVEEFGQYGLPILFHTGVTSYYFGAERKRENPEFGKMELVEKMVADTRGKADIILGHAGLGELDYTTERMARYPNVFVDTTFQTPQRIRKLISAFGSERVVFGSDWPYGDIELSIEYVRLALAQETDKRTMERILRDNIKRLIKIE